MNFFILHTTIIYKWDHKCSKNSRGAHTQFRVLGGNKTYIILEKPFEYYNKTIGVKIKFLIFDRHCHADSLLLISYNAISKRLKSKSCAESQLRRASLGCDALVAFNSLQIEWRNALTVRFGEPVFEIKKSFFAQNFVADGAAYDFFSSHRYGNNTQLDVDVVELYTNQASVLNTVLWMKEHRKQYIRSLNQNSVDIWQSLSNDVNAFKEVEHQLPTTKDSLRHKTTKYAKEGYSSIISGKYGSQNALLVTPELENLLISLYCLPNKPFVDKVHEMYNDFLQGKIEVVNIKTGEVYEPKDFYKNNKPVEISVSTVWNVVNNPQNILIISKYRNGNYDFNHKRRPHVTRTAPNFAMSKITLDDRDIMHTKLHDGTKVMAYYAFDVMSGAMIGIAHSKSKNHDLYIDCLRSMFRFTISRGLGVPMQMEVEQHLVSDFKDGLMKAGDFFPFVRWCNATNSQEKGAEHFIGIKKYGVEKDNNQNVGRHYSRRESNRTTNQKIFDAENDNYKFAKASFEEIVANELQEQIAYNNQPHPNKRKYPNQSRLEVFLNNINPDLPKINLAQLTRYIGNHTSTSVRRNQYVQVQYEKYQLASPQIIAKLQPNNYNVDAYYLPNENNEIKEVYLYQNGSFICECQPTPTFNTANAEWTDQDKQGYENATKYISQFDKMVKDATTEKLQKLTILPKQAPEIVVPQLIHPPTKEPEYEFVYADTYSERARAINDL